MVTDIDNITWSLKTLLVPSLLAMLSYFLFSRTPASSSDTNTQADETKTKIPVKPVDGSVKVSEIFIHPIKSCRGLSVQSANYDHEGFEYDRKYSMINVETNALVTARELPKMMLIAPRIDGDNLVVSFPEGSGCSSFSVPLVPSPEILATWKLYNNLTLFGNNIDGYIVQSTSPSVSPTAPSDILSAYFGKPVHMVYKGPEKRWVNTTHWFPELKATSVYQDEYAVHVLSEESVADVERETRKWVGKMGVEERWAEEGMQVRRFRPNIVMKGAGAWAENEWEEIRIGSKTAPKITLVTPCARCLLPNVCPDRGERDKAVPYKVTAKFRAGGDPLKPLLPCVGNYGVVDESGTVRVGDVIYVTKLFEEGVAGEKKEE